MMSLRAQPSWRSLVALLVSIVFITSPIAAAEFGYHPATDPTVYSQRGAGSKYVMKFRTGADSGITDSVYGFFHHNHNGSDTIDFVIYADNAGTPSDLVDTATSYRIVNTTQAWFGAKLTGQSLAANTDYWLGILVWSGGTSVRIYDDGTSSDSLKIRSDNAPPDNPFGTGAITTVSEGRLAIYVKYTPSSTSQILCRRRRAD